MKRNWATFHIANLARAKGACAPALEWALWRQDLRPHVFLATLGDHNPSWLAWLLVNVPEAREHMSLKKAISYDSGEWKGQIERVYA